MKYSYICRNCNKYFELDMPLAHYVSKPVIGCPYCESTQVARTYNVTNVIYKDDGFTKHNPGEE